MEPTRSLQQLTDGELLLRLADILRQSRRSEADLVAHIAEADSRRLYAREAAPSMYAYCTERLHLSEAEAYLRIAAARASRQHPILLAMLADGRLHLTAIAKLAPHLTPDNRDAVLARATHCSKRQVEELAAELAPRPDAPALIRKLPEPSPSAPSPTSLRPCPDQITGSSLELRPDAEREKESRFWGVMALEAAGLLDECDGWRDLRGSRRALSLVLAHAEASAIGRRRRRIHCWMS